MKSFVAWLRGINVGAAGRGRKAVPMAALRALAEELGYAEPRTHVQSGNLVFGAAGRVDALADALERAIEARFGFEVPVVVCRVADVAKMLDDCPFAEVVDERPNLVHAGFTRARLPAGAAAALEPYCKAGERVAVRGQRLWVDFPSGVARTKLTPAVLDRAAGGSVTMRNARTLRAVVALGG